MEKKQDQFFSEVIAILREADPDPNDWLDILKVQEILKISRRTVYRIRSDNKVRWMQIRGRTYFYAHDIFDLQNRFLK